MISVSYKKVDIPVKVPLFSVKEKTLDKQMFIRKKEKKIVSLYCIENMKVQNRS